jgi:hypothetical protein
MPATTKEISIPTTWGKDAADYLESHGLTCAEQATSIRSRDFDTCLSNPFHYYLTRRLGLRPAMSWSKALSRGSWFHHLFSMLEIPTIMSLYDQLIEARLTELRTVCSALKLSTEKTVSIIQREQKDAATALAWFRATGSVPVHRPNHPPITFQQFLTDKKWQIVGRELKIAYVDPDFPLVPLVAELDLLLYNEQSNSLWIVDAKTHSGSGILRLSTVAHEMQTQHYTCVSAACLPSILSHLVLPEDCRLAGMIHIALWKPTLEFGMRDRDFQWTSQGVRSGVEGRIRKRPIDYAAEWGPDSTALTLRCTGTFERCFAALHNATGKKPAKQYIGEPSLDNYVARILECYLAQGDYLHEKENREADPPVNWITTTSTYLQHSPWLTEYRRRLALIYDYATVMPWPSEFHRSIPDARGRHSRQKSDYYDFYVNPPARWPEIVQRNNFIIDHVDADLPLMKASALPHIQQGVVQ